MRAAFTTILVWLVLGGSPAGAAPAHPDPGELASSINGERTRAGVHVLARRADLDDAARRHSDEMAAHGGDPFHSADPGSGFDGWAAVGEVVGQVSAQDRAWGATLSRAFMESGVHRDELLDGRYELVGWGAAVSADGSAIYVTGVLMQPTAAAAGPAPRPTARTRRVAAGRAARSVAPAPSGPAAAPVPTPAPPVPASPPPTEAAPPVQPVAVPLPALPPPLVLDASPAGAGPNSSIVLVTVWGALVVAAVAPIRRLRRT